MDDRAPPKATWSLKGVHLAKRLSAGPRDRLAILRCATSTTYSDTAGDAPQLEVLPPFPLARSSCASSNQIAHIRM